MHFLKAHLRENQSLPLKREEAIDQTESLPACLMMVRCHCPSSLRHKGPKLRFFPYRCLTVILFSDSKTPECLNV